MTTLTANANVPLAGRRRPSSRSGAPHETPLAQVRNSARNIQTSPAPRLRNTPQRGPSSGVYFPSPAAAPDVVEQHSELRDLEPFYGLARTSGGQEVDGRVRPRTGSLAVDSSLTTSQAGYELRSADAAAELEEVEPGSTASVDQPFQRLRLQRREARNQETRLQQQQHTRDVSPNSSTRTRTRTRTAILPAELRLEHGGHDDGLDSVGLISTMCNLHEEAETLVERRSQVHERVAAGAEEDSAAQLPPRGSTSSRYSMPAAARNDDTARDILLASGSDTEPETPRPSTRSCSSVQDQFISGGSRRLAREQMSTRTTSPPHTPERETTRTASAQEHQASAIYDREPVWDSPLRPGTTSARDDEAFVRAVEEEVPASCATSVTASPAASVDLGSEAACAVCVTERRNTALNCGHVICEMCSLRLEHCPMCRSFITNRTRLWNI